MTTQPITFAEFRALPLEAKAELLPRITVYSGGHEAPPPNTPIEDCKLCEQEWLAAYLGLRHTDQPEGEPDSTVSRVISTYYRRLNDRIASDDLRTRLLAPALPLQRGTAGSAALEERRAWRLIDWLIREQLPAWCDLVPALSEAGQALRAAGPITDRESLRMAQPLVDAARTQAQPLRDEWYRKLRNRVDADGAAAADAAADAAAAAVAAADAVSAADGSWSARYKAAYKAARKVFEAKQVPFLERAAAIGRELCEMHD